MSEYQGVRDAFVLVLGSALAPGEDKPTLEQMLQEQVLEWWRKEHPEEQGRSRKELLAAAEEAIDAHPEPARLGYEICHEAFEGLGITEGYAKLARIIARGYCALVFTFDFTNKLEESLQTERLIPGEGYNLFVVGHHPRTELVKALSESEKITVVKLGGDLATKLVPVTRRSIEHNISQVRSSLHRLSRHNTLLVNLGERDVPVLSAISSHGERLWWVNRKVPIIDARHFESLKIEQPTALEYHVYLPEVVNLLKMRNSANRLLCREGGTFQGFTNQLYNRLVRYRSRATFASPRKKDLKILPEGPYKFLHNFDVADRELFYGRDKELKEFEECLEQEDQRLWLLLGRGGAGKTSLVKAGILPRLIEDESPYLYVRYEENLTEAFARAIKNDLGLEPVETDSPAEMVLAAAGKLNKRLLIFFDQYEHVALRLGNASRAWLNQEFARLIEQETVPLTLVLIARERFLGRLVEARKYLPGLFENLYSLPFLSFEGAYAAITKPAERFGAAYESDLVEQIIVDLSYEGIDPARLQLVCGQLFQQVSGMRKHELITKASYKKLGGAEGIIGRYLQTALEKLSRRDRNLAKQILKALSGSFNSSISLRFDRLKLETRANEDQLERVLLHLHDAGLVKRIGNPQERRYELTHERIVDDVYEWMTREEIAARQVRDLLVRSERDWERFNSLMSSESLAIVHRHRHELEFEPEQVELLVRSALTRGIGVRYWAERALELGDQGVALLEELLPQVSTESRSALAKALRSVKSPRTLRILLAELTSSGGASDQEVLASLKEQLPELRRLLKSEDETLVERAAEALARLEDKQALPELLQALRTEHSPKVDEALLRAYERIAGEKAAEQLVQHLQKLSGEELWRFVKLLAKATTRHKLIDALQKTKSGKREGAFQFLIGLLKLAQRQYSAAKPHLQEAVKAEPALENDDEFRKAFQLALEPPEAETTLVESFWSCARGNAEGTGKAAQADFAPPLEQKWVFNGPAMTATDPLVAEGLVVIGCATGEVLACDAQTGAEVWSTKLGPALTSTGAYWDKAFYFANQEGAVFKVDSTDGAASLLQTLGREVRAPLVAVEGKLLVPDWEGTLHCLNLGESRKLWSFKAEHRLLAQPVVKGGVCYFGSWDQNVYAVRLADGQLRWKFHAGAEIYTAAALAEDRLIVASDDGRLYCLAPGSGEVLWERDLESALRSSPAISAGRVLIGTGKGDLTTLDLKTGETLWSTPVDEEILAPCIIVGDWAYLGAMDGNFYAFEVTSGKREVLFETAYGIQQSAAAAEHRLYVPSRYYDVLALGEVEEPAT